MQPRVFGGELIPQSCRETPKPPQVFVEVAKPWAKHERYDAGLACSPAQSLDAAPPSGIASAAM